MGRCRRIGCSMLLLALAAAPRTLGAHDTGGWGMLQAQLAAEGAFAPPTPTDAPTPGALPSPAATALPTPPPTPPTAQVDPAFAPTPRAAPPSRGPSATANATSPAAASDEPLYQADTVVVRGRAANLLGLADSASEGKVSQEDLSHRPLLRPAEILEAVPGLAITQHSGDGKANQYFTRGFNLDHGTDFAFSVDDVPVNLPSQAHGQGYADLNFLIPELVDLIAYQKGAYNQGVGDFATAGSADFRYPLRLGQGLVQVTDGEFGYRRVLAAAPFSLGAGNAYAAVEGVQNNGPWSTPEDFQKLNALLHYSLGTADNGLVAAGSFYKAQWDATNQVARRAVEEGLVPANGNLDPSDGGDTERDALWLTWKHDRGGQALKAEAYALRSDLHLWNDFTYFLTDPVHGDQFEQVDQRTVEGLKLRDSVGLRLAGAPTVAEVGFDARNDNITALGLYHTQDRQVLSLTQFNTLVETGVAGYAGAKTDWAPWLRSELGFRFDEFHFDVANPDPRYAADQWAGMPQPKLGLTAGPFGPLEAYADYGWGFHSNDARILTPASIASATAADPSAYLQPLVRVRSAELGLRYGLGRLLQSTLALWQMNLDSELTFDGDAASSSVGPASTRRGVELSNSFHWGRVFLDADYAYSMARFDSPDLTDDPAHPGLWVPEAIEHMASATLGLSGLGPVTLDLRLRYFGTRALTPDNSVRSPDSTLLSAHLGWALGAGQSLGLDLFNLLDRQADDIAYDYTSRLPGEPAAGVEDIHAHPTEPRELRLSYRLAF